MNKKEANCSNNLKKEVNLFLKEIKRGKEKIDIGHSTKSQGSNPTIAPRLTL